MAEVLPMFPLGTVLFPHVLLPLHVFEPRYQELVVDCLSGARLFGVVLIERGSEVGGGDERFAVGTAAEMVRVTPLAADRYVVLAAGRERFRVSAWLPDDPYPRAEVDWLPEGTEAPGADALDEAEALVRRCAALRSELGEPAPPLTFERAEEPDLAAWQLASLAPVGPLDQQRLLEAESPSERVETLVALLREEQAVLASRLRGGQQWPSAPPDWS